MGESTISMAMFNSYVNVYQRVLWNYGEKHNLFHILDGLFPF